MHPEAGKGSSGAQAPSTFLIYFWGFFQGITVNLTCIKLAMLM